MMKRSRAVTFLGRRGPGPRAVLGVLLLATALLAASPAQAQQKRAVLLPFAGPGAAPVQQALQDALGADSRVKVLATDEIYSMASELGIDAKRLDKDPTLLSQAAAGAQVDAVVKGTVRGANLELAVVDGGTGNELRRLTVPLARGKLAGPDLSRAVQRLVPAIEGGQWMGQVPPELPPVPTGEGDESGGPPIKVRPGAPRGGMVAPPPVVDRQPARPYRAPVEQPGVESLPPPRRPASPPPPARSRASEYRPEAEPMLRPPPDEDVEDAGDLRRPPPERLTDDGGEYGGGGGGGSQTGGSALNASVGAAFLARAFDLENVRLADNRPGTVNYHSGYFPGLQAEAALYPLLLAGERGWLTGLGLEGSFEWGFLKSQVQEQVSDQGTTQRVDRMEPTTQYQMGAAAVYRFFPFAVGTASAMVKLHLGMGLSSFSLDKGTPGYTSNSTTGFRAGADLGVPFLASGPVVLGIDGGGSYLVGSTTLNDQARYPSSPSQGFDLLGGLRLTYGAMLVVRAGYFYQSTSTNYAATGQEPAASSSDRYQGFLFLLGYGG